MKDLKWWPEDYVDEVMPEGRDGPDAWIATRDGVAGLAPCEDEEMMSPLADGEVVRFVNCVTHADIVLTLSETGYSFAEPPPAQFEQCCCLNGWQIDTLAADVEEMVGYLRDQEAESGDYLVSFYTYSDGAPYRFDAASGRFSPIERADA